MRVLFHTIRQKRNSPEKEFSRSYPILECKTYGFNCDFAVLGKTEKVIKDFRIHTFLVHHIDYPEGVIMKFIERKF